MKNVFIVEFTYFYAASCMLGGLMIEQDETLLAPSGFLQMEDPDPDPPRLYTSSLFSDTVHWDFRSNKLSVSETHNAGGTLFLDFGNATASLLFHQNRILLSQFRLTKLWSNLSTSNPLFLYP